MPATAVWALWNSVSVYLLRARNGCTQTKQQQQRGAADLDLWRSRLSAIAQLYLEVSGLANISEFRRRRCARARRTMSDSQINCRASNGLGRCDRSRACMHATSNRFIIFCQNCSTSCSVKVCKIVSLPFSFTRPAAIAAAVGSGESAAISQARSIKTRVGLRHRPLSPATQSAIFHCTQIIIIHVRVLRACARAKRVACAVLARPQRKVGTKLSPCCSS